MFFPGSQLMDEPITNQLVMIGGFEGVLGEWGVEAEKTKFTMGHISAREALVHSRNAATVRLAYQHFIGSTDKLDLQPLKDLVAKAGVETPLLDYPSSLLGASSAKLDEMCLAYSCFPNNGSRPAKIHLINKITDAKDKVIFTLNEEDSAPVQSMDEIAASQINSCLVDALDRVGEREARLRAGGTWFRCVCRIFRGCGRGFFRCGDDGRWLCRACGGPRFDRLRRCRQIRHARHATAGIGSTRAGDARYGSTGWGRSRWRRSRRGTAPWFDAVGGARREHSA